MHTLETAYTTCPYCDEQITLSIDLSVSLQEYVEDCSVCCHPMLLTVKVDEDDNVRLILRREDEC